MRIRLAVALASLSALLAPAAARAELYGGVEIGARSVKAVVVDLIRDGDGYTQTVKMSDTITTAVTADLGKTGRFADAALRDTVKAVADLYERIRTEHKVPADRVFIAGSSGLFSAIRDKEDLIKENKKTLTEAVEKATGRKLGFVSDEREAELSIVGVIPAKQAGESALVDVGGGNSKGGCRAADGKLLTFSVPFGSVSFTDRVRAAAEKKGEPFAKQAPVQRDEELAPALRAALADRKEIAGRQRVYLGGGAVWALATLTHPGDFAPYVELTARDIEAYESLLRGEAKGTPAPDLSALKDEAMRKRAAEEWERVKKALTAEQLLGGAEVLKALSAEMGWHEKGKRLYFARDAYLGWLLPYVAEQAGMTK
jgi:exopolyphosphatase/pppGpp-phosphohydrolase